MLFGGCDDRASMQTNDIEINFNLLVVKAESIKKVKIQWDNSASPVYHH